MKLETQRLILRKPRLSDLEAIHKLVDDKIIKNFFMPYPYKQSHTKKFLSIWIKDWGIKTYWMAAELKNTKEVIGICGIREIDKSNFTAQALCLIGKEYRKNNYALETKVAIYDYCFEKLKLRKINSEVAVFNKESNLMQKRVGMKLEGTKREENFNPYLKKFIDMNIYSLLKEEWKKISPKLKKDLKNKNK
jgi:RimJ/RimL family protein N-acetyltransferase